MVDALVTVYGDAEEAGLAGVLADLVRGNLDREPRRARLLTCMLGTVGIVADDGHEKTEATLIFDRRGMAARPGLDPNADVVVRGTYETILGLSLVPMAGILPLPWRSETRDLLMAMLAGVVGVKGAASNPLLLLRLLGLVSVGRG